PQTLWLFIKMSLGNLIFDGTLMKLSITFFINLTFKYVILFNLILSFIFM
mgnify:CR=1